MSNLIKMSLTFAPGYTSENCPGGVASLPVDEQIDAFEKSYKIWVLDFAEKVVAMPDSGFAVLTILNAYPEMIAQLNGFSGSKLDLFQKGLQLVFHEFSIDIFHPDHPDLEAISRHLYSYMRNGLAHMSFTSTNIVLSETFPKPLAVMRRDGEIQPVLCINPRKWYGHIQLHFERYIEALKNPDNADLRDKFSARLSQPF